MLKLEEIPVRIGHNIARFLRGGDHRRHATLEQAGSAPVSATTLNLDEADSLLRQISEHGDIHSQLRDEARSLIRSGASGLTGDDRRDGVFSFLNGLISKTQKLTNDEQISPEMSDFIDLLDEAKIEYKFAIQPGNGEICLKLPTDQEHRNLQIDREDLNGLEGSQLPVLVQALRYAYQVKPLSLQALQNDDGGKLDRLIQKITIELIPRESQIHNLDAIVDQLCAHRSATALTMSSSTAQFFEVVLDKKSPIKLNGVQQSERPALFESAFGSIEPHLKTLIVGLPQGMSAIRQGQWTATSTYRTWRAFLDNAFKYLPKKSRHYSALIRLQESLGDLILNAKEQSELKRADRPLTLKNLLDLQA